MAAVFLDRDGVVVSSLLGPDGRPHPPRHRCDVALEPDARHSIQRLRSASFATIVVTNQPDIARGLLTPEDAAEINVHVETTLELDGTYVCPHDNGAACRCRKPRPGLLLTAAAERQIDLGRSWLIGDRWVDIAAGRAAGVRPVLLERAYSWMPTSIGSPPPDLRPDATATSLRQCVDIVMRDGARPC